VVDTDLVVGMHLELQVDLLVKPRRQLHLDDVLGGQRPTDGAELVHKGVRVADLERLSPGPLGQPPEGLGVLNATR
jgi:hypothetical protein